MTEIDLKITGEVASLRLEDGDRVIVTINDPKYVTQDEVERLRAKLAEKFAPHEVIILHGLSIAREAAA